MEESVAARPVGESPGRSDDRIPSEIRAIPVRRPGRWISAVLVLLAAGWLIHAFAESPNINYDIVWKYQLSSQMLQGLEYTIIYSISAQALGIALGILAAVMRLSRNPVLSTTAAAYIWLFRGVPILVQILFWYNIGLVFPRLGIGIPFTSIGVSGATNSIITTTVAAILALGLNEGAYMAEIVRAGVIAIDHGQTEAAHSIGLSPAQSLRHVILPQAMRVIIPPTGNDFISMLKTTSLVSVISGAELLTKAEQIYAQNFMTVELLITASIWYLVLTTVASVGQYFLEAHFQRGARRSHEALIARIVRNLSIGRVGSAA